MRAGDRQGGKTKKGASAALAAARRFPGFFLVAVPGRKGDESEKARDAWRIRREEASGRLGGVPGVRPSHPAAGWGPGW